MAHPRELDPLLAHADWVRRLAKRLVADGHQAEDLVQDTWLATLRGSAWRTARPLREPRLFLATVLRRKALQLGRTEGRRRAREARIEGPEAEPATDELLERVEEGRELARLALELEEPFRSVILLRHFDGLAPCALAERLGVPLKTVETRLARGHARLRERWRRRHPEDGAGVAALVAIARACPTTVPPAVAAGATVTGILGVMLMKTKLALLVLAALGGGGLLWLKASLAADERAEAFLAEPNEPHEAGALRDPGADLQAPTTTDATRHPEAGLAVAKEAAPAAPEPLLPSALRRLHGRVIDPEGFPMAGTEVGFRTADEPLTRTISSSAGDFELLAPTVAGAVVVLDPELECLFDFRPRAAGDLEMLLVVAHHRNLAGTVRHGDGTPIEGARVVLERPHDFATRFDALFDAADEGVWSVQTDRDGRFALERAPWIEGSRVEASLDGYRPDAWSASPEARTDIELVLERPRADGNALLGRVLDSAGQPVAGARVSLGLGATTSASDGTFQLGRGDDDDEPRELVAVRAGFLPGRLRAPLDAAGKPVWPIWSELILGGATLELSGRVVDEEGRPRPDVKLWLDDPTPFGLVDADTEAQLENLAAPEDSTYASDSDAYFRHTMTDAHGRFRLQGLLARDYRIGLMDTTTLEDLHTAAFTAGREDLRLVFPRAPLTRLKGRLLTGAGRSVPDVTVGLHAHAFGGVHHLRDQALTDVEGRFTFENVAQREVTFWLRGEVVVPTVRKVTAAGGAAGDEEVVLTVDVLCHFKVDLGRGAAPADSLVVLDAEGNALVLHSIDVDGVLQRSSWELVEGRSIPLGVSERAATLLLQARGETVHRVPLHLEPGTLRVIEL